MQQQEEESRKKEGPCTYNHSCRKFFKWNPPHVKVSKILQIFRQPLQLHVIWKYISYGFESANFFFPQKILYLEILQTCNSNHAKLRNMTCMVVVKGYPQNCLWYTMCQNYTMLFPSEYILQSKSPTTPVHVLIENKPKCWAILFLYEIWGFHNRIAEVWSLLGCDTSQASRPGSSPCTVILLQHNYT